MNNNKYNSNSQQNANKAADEKPIEIAMNALSPEALQNIIENFILREGTDYGANEVSHQTKIDQIRRQLEKGEIKIFFDQNTQTVNLVKNGKFK